MIDAELKAILKAAIETSFMYSDLCDGNQEVKDEIDRIIRYLQVHDNNKGREI
jgi:hypothetical protein